jgi:hypothetical protein
MVASSKRWKSLLGASAGDQEPSLLQQSPGPDVGVLESRAEFDGSSPEPDGQLHVTGVLRSKALRQGLVSVSESFRLTLQEMLTTGRPCGSDRELPLVVIFAAELEGDCSGSGFVPVHDVRLERAFPCLHCQVRLGGEPGRLGKGLKV